MNEELENLLSDSSNWIDYRDYPKLEDGNYLCKSNDTFTIKYYHKDRFTSMAYKETVYFCIKLPKFEYIDNLYI